MNKQKSAPDVLEDSYLKIYEGLSELRESFHRSGRLDDSNAKLDEISKLFATYLAYKNGQIKNFPSPQSKNLVLELQKAFLVTAQLSQYIDKNGVSIFGQNPSLVLRLEDELLANELVTLTRNSIDLAFEHKKTERPFDLINEAFGHFVRDNFRGNIEDAQYMTPPEVVDFVVDMVLCDLEKEYRQDSKKHFIMLDPSCGVGSFLTSTYHKAKKTNWLDTKRISLYGQDKVERMVRLSTINLELFDVQKHKITIGNSLELKSPIDHLNGKVDFILTNPPFGARFMQSEIEQHYGSNTPLFSNIKKSMPTVDSELLFVDRYMTLLKDGGFLAVVIPDGVVSAKGTAALIRQYLSSYVEIKAIIELPSVTFAQAGTRTKTAVLYLKKITPDKNKPIFMAVSKDLGFQVSTKKGVQVKTAEGENDLKKIISAYKESLNYKNKSDMRIISEHPSCVLVKAEKVLQSNWTPNHYSASRFKILSQIAADNSFVLTPLSDLADFMSDKRRSEQWKVGAAFISVLHILGEGFLDIGGVQSYAPITSGTPVNANELLISKINPRIPRFCVVPDLHKKILCSTEFEVLVPKTEIDSYFLAYLLQTSVVQKQILSLTSGTSSSHNRIRSSELAEVQIPVPKKGSKRHEEMLKISLRYKKALLALSTNAIELADIRNMDKDIFSID